MNSVLIIDDDKELCTLMKKCVEQENLSAVMAHDGLEGLRLLEENKDTCSLIILDVMMPDMDGFQVLQKIREKNNVPVLMLTAKSDEEDKVSGLRLGADDYLTKPFSINELMARINSLIRRYTTLNPVAGNEAATMLLKDMVVDKINRTVTVQNRPVRSFIRELCDARGKTILISSHILSEISLLADDVGIIDHGTVLEEESLEELEQKSSKHIHFTVSNAAQAARVLERDFQENHFSILDDHNIQLYNLTLPIGKIVTAFVANGLEVTEAHSCEESLEDYFRRVTGGEGIA